MSAEHSNGQRHVVIVGGGFAGVGCARRLAGRDDVRVTLIDRNNYHQFQPLLYQVATSQLASSDIAYSRERNLGGPPWEGNPAWKDQSPFWQSRKLKTPILVTVGERDFRVPLNNSLENWSVLQRLRVPSKLIVFPDENHWILQAENSRFFYQEVHAWIKRWLDDGG